MEHSSEKRLGTEPLGPLIFKLAIPGIAAQLINVLYNMVDRMYIGHIEDVGATALTGLGVCLPIIVLISAFSAFAGMGGAPLAAIELGKRIFLKEPSTLQKLESPKEIWESSKYLFHDLKQEHFYGYYFNNKQELIERKLLFMGTINSATTHTREIFKEAYKVSASSIVCLHNHPSNDTTPSQADIIFTERLMRTGSMQGIPVVDHIIVGENSFYSFYEHQNILNI